MKIQEDSAKNAEDLLGRKPYAETLAHYIADYKGKESVVFAINESWGYGKSVVLNYVKESLSKNKSLEIIEFNPWMFKNTADINSSFFEELRVSLDGKDGKELKKKILEYAELLKIISKPICKFWPLIKVILPLVSSIFLLSYLYILQNFFLVLSVILICLYIVSCWVTECLQWDLKRVKEKSLFKVKRELREEIKNSKKKFVFIIDDVDRLDRSEVLDLFKLIKLNADFPQFIYLLAFDEHVVAKMISDGQIDGYDYIKKIVQIPLALPKLRKSQLDNYLLDKLKQNVLEISKEFTPFFDPDKEENEDFSSVYYGGFSNFFKNLRDVKRFLNSFIFNLGQTMLKKETEVYFPDFLAIETIRVFNPKCYVFIRENKNSFVKIKNDMSYYSSEKPDDVKLHFNGLLPKMGVEDKTYQLNFIKEIFPYFKSCLDLGNRSGTTFENTATGKGRIYMQDSFDKYFALSNISPSEIKEWEKTTFFALATKDPQKLGPFLTGFVKEKRIESLFASVLEVLDEGYQWKPENTPKTFAALLKFYEETDFLPTNFRLLLMHILQNENNDIVFESLKEALPEVNDLAVILYVYHMVSVNSLEKWSLNDSQKEEMKKLLGEKLGKYSLSRLMDMKGFKLYILPAFDTFDMKDRRSEILKDVWKDNKTFLRFIGFFVDTDFFNESDPYYINKESVGRYLPIKDVEKRMDEIKQNDPDLVRKNKNLFEMFYAK